MGVFGVAKMKRYTTILAIALVGCAPLQEKADRYEEAYQRLLNPSNVKLCYIRRNGQIVGVMEYRCDGEGCELPECPE